MNDTYIQKTKKAADMINRIILGKEAQVRQILLAVISGGHILLEDIPGVGKTTLAAAVSKVFGLDSCRVQFTPDVMPSDLTGFSVYRRENDSFVYRPGSVFCNLLLADEINRTSPKTQSALLEAMEERRVSVEGETRELPNPFIVIATQNPFGSAGTQPLPDSQTDRFMISTSLGYPDFKSELLMAKSQSTRTGIAKLKPVMTADELSRMQSSVDEIYIKDSVLEYILRLVTATRTHKYLLKGASPRATIALTKMSKSAALLDGRDFVMPSDAEACFKCVINHRIILTAAAVAEGITKDDVINDILKTVTKPPIGEHR